MAPKSLSKINYIVLEPNSVIRLTLWKRWKKKLFEESKTKTEIIKTLPENVNIITSAYRIISENNKSDIDKLDIYEQPTMSDDFREPRWMFKMLNPENKTVTETIKVSKNPFDVLKQKKRNTIHFDIVHDSNTTIKILSIIFGS